MKKKEKWNQGSYFLLDSARYLSGSESVSIRFRNRDEFHIRASSLWQNRPGKALWNRIRVDPETHGALLIPSPGGELQEIPGDVIRMVTNADYRAHVVRLASDWADQIGRHLSAFRKARGLTQKSLAEAAGLGRVSLAKVETGKVEPSFSTVVKLLAAMGASVQDLPHVMAS